jgi:hypothetical protein
MKNIDSDTVTIRVPRKQAGKMLHVFGVGISNLDLPRTAGEGDVAPRQELWDLYHDMYGQVMEQKRAKRD